MTYDEFLNNERKKRMDYAQQTYNTRSAQNNSIYNNYLNGMNQAIDLSTQHATGQINDEIQALPQQYQSMYDANAVRQIVNERKVAERMANLGLTDSGLNRTQQTALAVQRTNADAALDSQKNNAILSFKKQINDIIANGEVSKQQLAAQTNLQLAQTNQSTYDNLMNNAENMALSAANNWQDNQTALAKAKLEYDAALKKARIEQETARIKAGNNSGGSGDDPFGTGPTGSSKKKSPTNEMYQEALEAYFKGNDEFAEWINDHINDYDTDLIAKYINKYGIYRDWVFEHDGGINWGGGIDNNAKIKSKDGKKIITMKQLYEQFIKDGMSASDAKYNVMVLQNRLGLSTTTPKR